MKAKRSAPRRNPLPLRQEVNKDGVAVSAYLMRSIRQGISDINYGRAREFGTAHEAIAELHKAAGIK